MFLQFSINSPISIFNLPFSFFSLLSEQRSLIFFSLLYIAALYFILSFFYFFDQWVIEIWIFVALFFLTWVFSLSMAIVIALLLGTYFELNVTQDSDYESKITLNVYKYVTKKIISLCSGFVPVMNTRILTGISYLFCGILVVNLFGILLPTPAIMTSVIYTLVLTLNCFSVFVFLAFGQGNALKNFVLAKMNNKSLKNSLFGIEILSFLARFISLPVRLFSNIFAGHVLMKLISVFTFLFISSIFQSIFISTAAILAWCLLLIITAFEIAMAVVQAYVLTMLVTSYYGEYIM